MFGTAATTTCDAVELKSDCKIQPLNIKVHFEIIPISTAVSFPKMYTVHSLYGKTPVSAILF